MRKLKVIDFFNCLRRGGGCWGGNKVTLLTWEGGLNIYFLPFDDITYLCAIMRKCNLRFWTRLQGRGGGWRRAQKVILFELAFKIRFRTFLTKINHFCQFLSNILFSRKCNFRPFLTQIYRFFSILWARKNVSTSWSKMTFPGGR